MENNIVKQRIKHRRKELDLSLEDVAQRVGVNRSTVQRWESGDIASLGTDKIAKLATALQVSPEYLLGWTDDKGLKLSEGIASEIATLTEEELASVLNYIHFLKSQRRNNG